MRGCFSDVPAELISHRRQNFGREVTFAARGEALEERSREYRSRRGGFNRSENRPAAFAGIGDTPGETLERGLFKEGDGRQIEKPRSHHAAAPPHFGDVRQINVVLIMLGIPQRSSLRIAIAM